MIYFTSFVFTLLLAHIARAVPACGDVLSSQKMYDTTYEDTEQLVVATYKVTWDATYDNAKGSTNSVACSNLTPKYPHFNSFPDFPFLGGAHDVHFNSPNCAKCWKLTETKTHRFIYFTAIDASASFNIGKRAFTVLNGGTIGNGTLQAEATPVAGHFCGFK